MNLDVAVQQAANEVFGAVPKSFPIAKIASSLRQREQDSGLKLSPYGYLAFLLDRKGGGALFANIAASTSAIDEFVTTSRLEQQSFPVNLLNAVDGIHSLLDYYDGDIDIAIRQMKNMYDHAILFMLLIINFPELAEKFKEEAKEKLRRYPCILDALPEQFRNIGLQLLDKEQE